jgi:hypothetical protein
MRFRLISRGLAERSSSCWMSIENKRASGFTDSYRGHRRWISRWIWERRNVSSAGSMIQSPTCEPSHISLLLRVGGLRAMDKDPLSLNGVSWEGLGNGNRNARPLNTQHLFSSGHRQSNPPPISPSTFMQSCFGASLDTSCATTAHLIVIEEPMGRARRSRPHHTR